MFKQQASIITNKKEAAATRLAELMTAVQDLGASVAQKSETVKNSSAAKMLKGDDFKKYVAELRVKSSLYKTKKSELSELVAEQGILSRTIDVRFSLVLLASEALITRQSQILKAKEKQFSDQLAVAERKSGVSGFTDAQETLEKVSEQKSSLDEAKETTIGEISTLVEKLVQTINARLPPFFGVNVTDRLSTPGEKNGLGAIRPGAAQSAPEAQRPRVCARHAQDGIRQGDAEPRLGSVATRHGHQAAAKRAGHRPEPLALSAEHVRDGRHQHGQGYLPAQ